MILNNFEAINGLSAISKVIQIYNTYENQIADKTIWNNVVLSTLGTICATNSSLKEQKYIGNKRAEDAVTFANIQMEYCNNTLIQNGIKNLLPHLQEGKTLILPVKINVNEPFCVMIDISEKEDKAFSLIRSVLYHSMVGNKKMVCRCLDMKTGGNCFGDLLKMIHNMAARTGGKVYQKDTEFGDLLKEMEKNSVSVMAKTYGCESAQEYNRMNDSDIQEYLYVLYLTSEISKNHLKNLKVIMDNYQKNGMNFLVIGEHELIDALKKDETIHFSVSGDDMQLCAVETVKVILDETTAYTNEDVEQLLSAVRDSLTIETKYELYEPELPSYFTMDSTEVLRIPYALDDKKQIQYLDINSFTDPVSCPPYVLVTGGIGSGKSQTLHTCILQIVKNYHPDDVEIWAIDYKAQEFNKYLDVRSPHFRIVGLDDSEEYSLSLVELIYEEYQKRKNIFKDAEVGNLMAYRRKYGKYAMTRIVIVIDEFQMLTQAVQRYAGSKDYKTILENILRLSRTTGFTFIFGTQTAANGLSGLSDAAKEQIGHRICMNHKSANEVRETLALSGQDSNQINIAKTLGTGQAIQRYMISQNVAENEDAKIGFKKCHVIYMELVLKRIISECNAMLKDNYKKKDVIIVRDNSNYSVAEKERHSLMKFLYENYKEVAEEAFWYPAAPSTLADEYKVTLDHEAGANMLLIGENAFLRNSIVVHSVMGFLMNKNTKVIVSVVDEEEKNRKQLLSDLKEIHSERLQLNIGTEAVLDSIISLKKIKPLYDENRIYVWYGLDKLKNAINLLKQEYEEEQEELHITNELGKDPLDELGDLLKIFTGTSDSQKPSKKEKDIFDYDTAKAGLAKIFDMGPENGYYNFCIFHNYKTMKKSGMLSLGDFEHRIGMQMSSDDSYNLFGSSLAINKTKENVVIHYSGTSNVIPLRPYLMPEKELLRQYNRAIRELEE